MSRVEISGGIASGKTTLARLLEEHGVRATYENFKSNPFWRLFYSSPREFAFETEITFLLQHYNQIKVTGSDSNLFVLDTSLVQDAAYAKVNLEGHRKAIFDAVYEEVLRSSGWPKLLVHLGCPPDEQLRRIRARGRTEEKSIEVSYLSKLTNEIAVLVAAANDKAQILRIDSAEVNFATEYKAKSQVVRSILELV